MAKIVFDNQVPNSIDENNVSNIYPEKFLRVIVEDTDVAAKNGDRWFNNSEGWYLDASLCWSPNIGIPGGCESIVYGSSTISQEFFRGYAVPFQVKIEERVRCMLADSTENFLDNVKKVFVPKIAQGILSEFYGGSFAQSQPALSGFASYLLRSDADDHDAPTIISDGVSPQEGIGLLAHNLELCSGSKGIIWMNTKFLSYFADMIDYVDGFPYFNGNLIIASPYIDDKEPYPYGGVPPVYNPDEPYIYATSPAVMLLGVAGDEFLQDMVSISINNTTSLQLFGFAAMNFGCCKVAVKLKVCP